MSLIVNNTFDNFFEYWFTYDYERDKNQKNPFVPVTWEDYDGVNNSGHIWTDDNRWTIDALENPVSIIPLIHYRGEEICDKGITYYHTNTVDFTNVTISFYLKKENLNLYNAHFKAKNIQKKEIVEFERVTLPKEYVPLCENKSIYSKRIISYLKSRDIEYKDIIKYKIGTCLSGKYEGMIIFPSFDKNGCLNYFTARTINNKYYFIPRTQKGYKNNIIINELNLDFSKPIIIVEGFVDMIKTGMENVSPLFGSSLNKNSKLFGEIVKNSTKTYIVLDSDADEMKKRLIKSLISYGIVCYTVNVSPYKDVGEMNYGEFIERFNKAEFIDESELLKLRMR